MSDLSPQPFVVLIHGLGGHRMLLLPLAWRLQRAGFATKRFGYRSVRGTIEIHAQRFREFLDQFDKSPQCKELNIVAHSMGAIVTRQALLDWQPAKLKRIVMLGPPNQGSPAASFLSRRIAPWCRTLGQLGDAEDSFVRNLPVRDNLEIGIIAARWEWAIPETNSHLPTESAHVVINSGHNDLLVRPTASQLVEQFLTSGSFDSVCAEKNVILNEAERSQ